MNNKIGYNHNKKNKYIILQHFILTKLSTFYAKGKSLILNKIIKIKIIYDFAKLFIN